MHAQNLHPSDYPRETMGKKRKLGATSRQQNVTNRVNGDGGHRSNEHQHEQLHWSKSKKKRMRRIRANANRAAAAAVSTQSVIEYDEIRNNEKKQRTKVQKGNRKDLSEKREIGSKKSSSMKSGVSGNAESASAGKSVAFSSHGPGGGGFSRPKSALQQAFLERLSGSRFRELNEELYTSTSREAYERFQSNPSLFDQYHEGFRRQVMQWPVNPVDVILRWITELERCRTQGKREGEKLVVADFGCGDAKLATELLQVEIECDGVSDERNDTTTDKWPTGNKQKMGKPSNKKECRFIIHSFDLISNGNPLVTECDIANVPLDDGSVDVAVFSLALMGTNVADFIREAHRVLRPDGILKIAEVRSRFESTVAPDVNSRKSKDKSKKKKYQQHAKCTDTKLLNKFMDVMVELGFDCRKLDRSNKMFVLMEFEKTGKDPCVDARFTPKPCIYKRR